MASLRPTIQLKTQLSFLVSLAHQLDTKAVNALPDELYRPESVETSVTINSGSVFSISRQRVPKVPPYRARSELGGTYLTTQIVSKQPDDLEWIVYKVADVEFAKDGNAIADHQYRLAAVLVELLVLSHNPVRLHPFLPTLYGFAWARNQYHTNQRIPVPITDWADCGSLSDYQGQNPKLCDQSKQRLAWQIGTALQFLHDCAIHHGDVKSENVLLSKDKSGTLNAKLSDFGMSVVSERGYLRYLPAGTLDWIAPEIRWTLTKTIDLAKADTFSFGLTVWRMYCDNWDPLALINIDYDALKRHESSESWDLTFLPRRPGDSTLKGMMETDEVLDRAFEFSWLDSIQRAVPFSPMLSTALSIVRSSFGGQMLRSVLPPLFETQQVPTGSQCPDWLVAVLLHSLPFCSSARDLSACVEALELGQCYQKPSVEAISLDTAQGQLLSRAASNYPTISWYGMRDLDSSTRDLIMKQRYAKSITERSSQLLASVNLGTAACMISGMGTDKYEDVEQTLSLIESAARMGSVDAGSLVYRMYDAFDRDIPDGVDFVRLTYEASCLGSTSAYKDLKIIAGERAPAAKWSLHHQTCGVGADFYFDYNCLHGWSFARRNDLDWIKAMLLSTEGDPQLVLTNKRGDNFLHAAVTLKLVDLFHCLLDDPRFKLNATNHEGETPLLCALRAGSTYMAHKLLDKGADPSIVSRRGESPLHWVINSAKHAQETLVDLIITKGGSSTITCWSQLCEYAAIRLSHFVHYEERLCAGTPLHWAICRQNPFLVNMLMEKGALPDISGPNNERSPLEIAAHLHEAEILRLLITKQHDLEARPLGKEPSEITIFGGDKLYRSAIAGSDRFSLICRHGKAYSTFSRRTFAILEKEFSNTSYIYGIDGQGRSALHYATQKGYDEAVKNILRYRKQDNGINDSLEGEFWTPICDAVARDHVTLFKILQDSGADMKIRVDSPSRRAGRSWGLLHIAAQHHAGERTEIIEHLLELGLPTDGYLSTEDEGEFVESPLSLAIENDAFKIADVLRQSEADINARTRHLFGGRIKLTTPVSILGRVIAANMRHSKHKLEYLLYPSKEMRKLPQADFMIVPEDGITALHWSLLLDRYLPGGTILDPRSRLVIFRILLERFDSYEAINAQTVPDKATVLHYAVSLFALDLVKLLVDEPGGADITIQDSCGRTALGLAQQMKSQMMERSIRPGFSELKNFITIKQIVLFLEGASETSSE